ncbi:DUF559 domain-containing protein [Jatrophihabitans sp.]|uniref:endonuclease domain-containing protein n=1 Tax=Jatrophihabitans sp. TaxID=1932789 RepID=UPI0030C7665E|nr:uncharacterized protein [Jatrophihabitans sp.]
MPRDVDLLLDQVLARSGGTVTRDQVLRSGLTRHELDNAVKRRLLVAVFPRTYCREWSLDDPQITELAALRCVGAGAVSHLSALRRWGLLDGYAGSAHVTVSASRMPRAHPGLVVHRVASFPGVARVAGAVTVRASTALATSWPLLAGPDQRAPMIKATRSGLVTTGELAATVSAMPRLTGRRALLELVELLGGGCESELEIWGHVKVFDVAGLRHAVRQLRVVAAGRTYRLDRAYRAERVAVELDGAAHHGSRSQRERDLVRDAALASRGWLVVRFSHRRLHDDVRGCRRDLLAVLARRR